jgi:hypothetical protein
VVPQDDPTKAVNIGVAAHITAASPGGPRYDPDLLPEERSGPGNEIWLCQNHGKLVDNDVTRFTVDILRKWKADAEAEAEARDRVGKTTAINSSAVLLEIGVRVRMGPIIPQDHERSDFLLVEDNGEHFVFEKSDSMRQVFVPKSLVEKIHSFGNSKPSRVQLGGRLQWVSAKRDFEIFSEKPPAGPAGANGIPKEVDVGYPSRQGIIGKFAREDRLPEVFSRGWLVFYDFDGKYLRWGNRFW